ncbi:hypothetical protein Tco_0413298 [Tanacetum coccineum]
MDEECLLIAKIGRKDLKETRGAQRVYTQGLYGDEDAQDMGRTRDVVDEEKENDEDVLSTAQQKVSTDKEKVSTDRPIVSTDGSKVKYEGRRKKWLSKYSPPTSTIFGEDETIAQSSQMKSSQSVLVFKREGEKVDEEMVGKYKKEWEDEEKNETAQTKKRGNLAIEERANSFMTQCCSKKILLNKGNFKILLENKRLRKQALYEKIKRSDEDFISIGSAEDERLIKRMNEKGINSSKNEVVKEEDKEEEDSEIIEKKSVIARLNKRLYESCGVCILEFEDGIVIHMLVERRCPLSKELLQRMLDLGLEVERESSVALDLIRHKNWLGVQLTLLYGEELASPRSNSSCLTIPQLTATGKGTSNLLIAGSLPKTTKPT